MTKADLVEQVTAAIARTSNAADSAIHTLNTPVNHKAHRRVAVSLERRAVVARRIDEQILPLGRFASKRWLRIRSVIKSCRMPR